jgi:hypothetical protein
MIWEKVDLFWLFRVYSYSLAQKVRNYIINPTNSMIKIALLAVLAIVSYSTMVPHLDPIETHVPLVYKVSLNDPP